MLRCVRVLVVAALVAFAAFEAAAEDYPSRPIRLLIHTPPGSLVDVLGRLVGQELGDRLGPILWQLAPTKAYDPEDFAAFLDLLPDRRDGDGVGVKLTPKHYAYLKISEGCNHRCSFCIIPSMRGKLVSRPVGEVLSEAERLVKVEWSGAEPDGLYLVAVQVEALDRQRLLSDITKAIADENVNILSATLQMKDDNRVTISRYSFEMANPGHLGQVLSSVRRVEGVYDAYRITNSSN